MLYEFTCVIDITNVLKFIYKSYILIVDHLDYKE